MTEKLYEQIGSCTMDNLIAGENVPILVKSVTLKAGKGIIKRGSVLGIIKTGAVTVTPAAGNTGDGEVTGAATGKNAKVGNYVLTCIAAATDKGTFSVVDPDGVRLADAVVGTAYSGAIKFTIGDGTADFVVGDKITLAVAAGSGLALLVDKAALDGSNIANCILTDEVDTGAADATVDIDTQVYTSGLFNRKALVFAANNAAADHEAQLRELGIFLADNIAY